jgi:hypothetical protein
MVNRDFVVTWDYFFADGNACLRNSRSEQPAISLLQKSPPPSGGFLFIAGGDMDVAYLSPLCGKYSTRASCRAGLRPALSVRYCWF